MCLSTRPEPPAAAAPAVSGVCVCVNECMRLFIMDTVRHECIVMYVRCILFLYVPR